MINHIWLATDFNNALSEIATHRFAPLREQILFVQMYLLLAAPETPKAVNEYNRRVLYVLHNLLRACEAEDFESSEFWTSQLEMLNAQGERLQEEHKQYINLETN